MAGYYFQKRCFVNNMYLTLTYFKCFDYILDTVNEPLTEDYIKTLHRILKSDCNYVYNYKHNYNYKYNYKVCYFLL